MLETLVRPEARPRLGPEEVAEPCLLCGVEYKAQASSKSVSSSSSLLLDVVSAVVVCKEFGFEKAEDRRLEVIRFRIKSGFVFLPTVEIAKALFKTKSFMN